jgi:hypothetical protein
MLQACLKKILLMVDCVHLEELVRASWHNLLQLAQPIHHLVSLLTPALALSHCMVSSKGHLLR